MDIYAIIVASESHLAILLPPKRGQKLLSAYVSIWTESHKIARAPDFFCNHFEELQTVSFEVELTINNAPLTHVYLNTIETCLTPNHLLFDRQLLYPSNTTSTVVRNLTVLSRTTNKINRISNHFWRHGYVVKLHETERTSKLNINSLKINVNDIVLFFIKRCPDSFGGFPW